MATQFDTYGGTNGSRYRLNIDYTEDQVNEAANTSRVNCTIRMSTTNNFGYFHTGDPGGYLIIDGTQYNFGGDYDSDGTQTFLVQSKTITHTSDGSKSINIQGYHQSDQSPGMTSASLSFTYVLTNIDRTTSISAYTHTLVTDTSITLNVTATDTCDLLEYNINSAGWVTGYSGSFTSRSVTLTDLVGNTSHSILVRVRRTDSQQKTTSSAVVSTTVNPNNFLGFIRR